MTIHDVVKVAGVSESCRYNDHSDCIAPGCGCTCHIHAAIPPPPTGLEEVGPENSCPKCGIKRPSSESYCRIDGTKLTSLACGMCGRGMNPEDLYCFNCGAPKGTIGTVKIPQVVTVPAVEGDSGRYEHSILRGLQEELSNVQTDQGAEGPVRVVEQPAGTGGSFKIVSAPNPNKIRTPIGGTRPAIKLPVKPT